MSHTDVTKLAAEMPLADLVMLNRLVMERTYGEMTSLGLLGELPDRDQIALPIIPRRYPSLAGPGASESS